MTCDACVIKNQEPGPNLLLQSSQPFHNIIFPLQLIRYGGDPGEIKRHSVAVWYLGSFLDCSVLWNQWKEHFCFIKLKLCCRVKGIVLAPQLSLTERLEESVWLWLNVTTFKSRSYRPFHPTLTKEHINIMHKINCHLKMDHFWHKRKWTLITIIRNKV